jgi:GNAT superfamily N-acetyltransferase
MLVATAALARRLDAIAQDYLIARYSGPGNPMQAQILRSGSVVATKVPFAPTNQLMNTARGLEAADELQILLAFYAETNQPCWVEVSPYAPAVVTSALIGAGFRVERYAATLYAAPLPMGRLHDLEVGEIAAPELDEFLDTLNAGFGTADEQLERLRANQSFWAQVPAWHLFLARVDGRAAGAAVLSIHGDAAYLAAAATLPEYRNLGIQNSLIDARIARARSLGCELVAAQAAWGTSSQGNLQRAGLQMSHVRTLWTNCPAE